MLDHFQSEFTDLQIYTETKYMKVSFTHKQTELQVSLNVNNIAGVFNSLLIAHFNQIDERFHKLSVFLLRWHRSFLQFRETQYQHTKPLHIMSVYALQMMLVTWMQHVNQMARFDSVFISQDASISTFGLDGEKLSHAMKKHSAMQN